MEAVKRDVEDVLRRRYWLKDNFEWFMGEVTFHKEMSEYFGNTKLKLWHFGDEQGKVTLNEIAD